MQFLQKTTHFLWQPAAWLRVTGEDALSFLQGQLTQDLRHLMPGQAVYGLWLNQKGKMVADSFVLRDEGGAYFLGSYHSPAAVIRERLEAYIIADDVTIRDETTQWRGVTLWSDEPPETWRADLPGGFVFRGRREVGAHWEWVAPVAAVESHAAQLGPAMDAAEVERRRIVAGIPAVPQDLGPNDLPNEGGLERDAISYTKGCYLGQEVMARLKAMGQVRRRLLRVRGTGAVPALPAALFADGREAGELRSAAEDADGFAGLAMVTLRHVPADGKLALAADAAPALQLAEQP